MRNARVHIPELSENAWKVFRHFWWDGPNEQYLDEVLAWTTKNCHVSKEGAEVIVNELSYPGHLLVPTISRQDNRRKRSRSATGKRVVAELRRRRARKKFASRQPPDPNETKTRLFKVRVPVSKGSPTSDELDASDLVEVEEDGSSSVFH